MSKLAPFVVAAVFTGGMVTLGVVSIPNAMRAYRSAHPVPLAAEFAQARVPQHRGAFTLDAVTVVGDPNSSFRQQLQAPTEPPMARAAETAAPCAPEWQTLRAGPTERRYRELCSSEISAGAVDTPERAKAGPERERLVAPPHQGLDEHVLDPRALTAHRPPLQIGEPESP